jgi:Glyoxalase-like domain
VADPKPEIADVIVDCLDTELVARFWSELLQRPITGRKGPYMWLERTGNEVGIGFQKVVEEKTGKNRVHLDISGPDVASLWKRIEALGGSRVGVSRMVASSSWRTRRETSSVSCRRDCSGSTTSGGLTI